jgi:hypothetical protein
MRRSPRCAARTRMRRRLRDRCIRSGGAAAKQPRHARDQLGHLANPATLVTPTHHSPAPSLGRRWLGHSGRERQGTMAKTTNLLPGHAPATGDERHGAPRWGWSPPKLCETRRGAGGIPALARQSAGTAARQQKPAAGAAAWLGLAAAPTFAAMALSSGSLGAGQTDTLCSSAQEASLLSGMLPMYLLMSVFHLGPWLQLLSRWRGPASG